MLDFGLSSTNPTRDQCDEEMEQLQRIVTPSRPGSGEWLQRSFMIIAGAHVLSVCHAQGGLHTGRLDV